MPEARVNLTSDIVSNVASNLVSTAVSNHLFRPPEPPTPVENLRAPPQCRLGADACAYMEMIDVAVAPIGSAVG